MNKLKQDYNNAVYAYMVAFANKQGLDYKDYFWCGGNDYIGTTCSWGDYYFSFEDIYFDINKNIPKDTIFDYHDYCLENAGNFTVNYKSFTMGVHLLPEPTNQQKKAAKLAYNKQFKVDKKVFCQTIKELTKK